MEHASVSRSSWISWPLSFLLHGVFDDLVEEPAALPVRFRNWNTRLTLKGNSDQKESFTRRSPSPGETLHTNGSVSSSRRTSPSNLETLTDDLHIHPLGSKEEKDKENEKDSQSILNFNQRRARMLKKTDRERL